MAKGQGLHELFEAEGVEMVSNRWTVSVDSLGQIELTIWDPDAGSLTLGMDHEEARWLSEVLTSMASVPVYLYDQDD